MTAVSMASARRHTRLDRAARWRCLVHGDGPAACGTLIGAIELDGVVIAYEVALDAGDAVHVWPSRVEAVPPPAHKPALRVIEGGLA